MFEGEALLVGVTSSLFGVYLILCTMIREMEYWVFIILRL